MRCAFGMLVFLCSVGLVRAESSITTSGEAVIYVQPDEVAINFGVETTSTDLDKVKTLNDEASARLLKSLKTFVEEKQIQTDHLQIEIRYQNQQQLNIEGYIARRSYSVVLKDTKKFEPIVSAGIRNGANRLLGFQYRTTELRKHRDAARKMAIKAAKEKAVALAGELDCTIGAPRSISEGGGYYGYGGSQWGFNSYNMAQNSAQVAAGEGGEDSATMPLGQISIRANVTVMFDLQTMK